MSRRNLVRAAILVYLVAILNGVDLYLTLFIWRSFGFSEANPVANSVMQMGEFWLVAFKTAVVVAASIGLIYAASKNSRSATYACWFLFLVFAALMIVWAAYTWEVVGMAEIDPDEMRRQMGH